MSALVALFICNNVFTAELQLNELRLSYSILPTNYDYTLEDHNILSSTNGAITASDNFSDAWMLSLHGVQQWGNALKKDRFLTGLGLTGSVSNYDDGNNMEMYTAELLLGYAYWLTPKWNLHVKGSFGLGMAMLDLRRPMTGNAFSVDGLAWTSNAEIGLSFLANKRWQLTTTLNWQFRHANMSGDNLSLDINNPGIAISLGFGYILGKN